MATSGVVPGEVCVARASMSKGSRHGDADPVRTEVIRHALNSVAAQMKIALRRAAFSPMIYEIIDFAAAIYDREVRLLAQADALPLFMGTLNSCVEQAVEAVGGEGALQPGDVLLTTYGYATGSHPNDLAVVVPVFFDGELVAYTAVKAHQMDVGAKEPYSTDTIDNFQEGLILPGVKLYAGGVRNEDLYRVMLANSRMPEEYAGDVQAEVACCHTGADGLTRLIGRYGRDEFLRSVERMFDHGEALARAVIERIPDGRYTASGMMDSNGVDADPIPFDVTVEIAGSDCIVDFTDAPPTQAGPTNCPQPGTVSAARLAIMAVIGGGEALHEGSLRPVEVRTRTNTMFHPLPPAPIFLYGWPTMQSVDVIHRALAQAVPDMVRAGSGSDECAIMWWGNDDAGEMWATGYGHTVGHGAMASGDGGAPLIVIPLSGVRSTPAELIEPGSPMIVRRCEIATDSAGAGRFAGGPGLDIEYEMTRDAFMTSVIERTQGLPFGLQGGAEGRPNALRLTLPDGTEAPTAGKTTGLAVAAGTRILIETAGGGGFGEPGQREPDAVRRDVELGYLSEDAARERYPAAHT